MYLFDLEDYNRVIYNYHFNPDGFYNDKNSWISDDLDVKIIWDDVLNAWRMSGDTLGTTQIINNNPDYPPINNNWVVLGSYYQSTATQGECVPVDSLVISVASNSPSCTCDGSINVTATGGVPPYQYSYNNGVSFVNSPFKTGLCGGIYNVTVVDSEDNSVSSSVTLAPVTPTTQYAVTFDETLTVIGGNELEYNFVLNVTPQLPSGVVITFDMDMISEFYRTPTIDSATSSFFSEVKKNGVLVSYVDNTNETTGVNTQPGCQGLTTYSTNYSHKYNGLTLNSTDVYQIKVVTDFELDCDGLGPCCSGFFRGRPPGSYISGLSINGCNCCTVLPVNYTQGIFE